MSRKTWGGRFSADTDKRVEAYTESISYDRRLYIHDIHASKAHATMLSEVKLISVDEAKSIHQALEEIQVQIEVILILNDLLILLVSNNNQKHSDL